MLMSTMVKPPFHILVVDDDPAVLRILTVLLTKQGYVVETAKNGQEALDILQLRPQQIIITDWEMPEKNGLELIQEIRQNQQNRFTYIILLTARSSVEDLTQAFDAEASDFISKPVSPQELLARVRAGQRIVELEQNLRQLSENDGLTNVLNRRTFHNQLQREWARSARYEQPLSAVIMDVDFFKRINDEHGHPAGDAVLISVANMLRENCRPSDYICRYGGEEFVVLLPQTDEIGAQRWAERMRLTMAETPIITSDKTLHITASFGVAEKLEDATNPDTLIDCADQCLLIAKRTGRNKVMRFSQLNDLTADPFANNNEAVHPLEGVHARDVMSTLVMTLNTTDSIIHAVELVLQMRLPSVPVVDSTGHLAGIISEKDLMLLDIARDGWNKTVGDVMKTNVVAYEENTPAKEIFDFLCRVSIRRVVVVSQGQPIGMLSRDTYLRWYSNWLIAKGVAKAPERFGFGEEMAMLEENFDQPITPRERLLKTANTLVRNGNIMVEQLQENENIEEMIPCVVGGATRMQDLATDLLGHCQQVFG
jgi:two-component system, cell cycle response regulator